jgi:hypothetical protein
VTSGGAVWLDTGGGPVAVDQDLNMEFLGSTSATGPFSDLISLNDGTTPALLLLSNQTAKDWFIVHSWEAQSGESWPGYWGIFGAPNTDYQAWGIPSLTESAWGYIKMRAWTGNFNSFADAVAGGAYFAESTIFTTHFAYMIDPTVGDFANMPAMILKHALAGDANMDGTVNINDLSKVLTNYDKSGMTWSEGDFSGDGIVNITDLSKVLTNYDKSVSSSAVGITAVPEPATMPLLLILAALAVMRAIGRKPR